ncbi:MAG: septal ring lytic transglycosylase RlpA family protein, partial [Candidatus Competibacter sp.]|nr:septal ring lytic transglycosylase RlpA family protein [Candidatus Competibacter sp.]
MAKSYWRHALLYSSLATALAGCGTVPEKAAAPAPVANAPQDVPQGSPEPARRLEPASRSGNPDTYVVFGRRYRVKETSEGYREQGIASWYGKGFHGRKTSSGPLYNMFDLTAAHKSLPIPSYVRVTNLENGRNVVVKVNDRGPFVGQRLIDLSYAAAARLEMLGKGTAPVEVTALEPYQLLPKLAARRAEALQRVAGGPSPSRSDGASFGRLAREETRPFTASALAPAATASGVLPPAASAPLSANAIAARVEPPKPASAEPASGVAPPESAAARVARVEPAPPALLKPARSEPVAARAETSQQPAGVSLQSRPDVGAAGSAPGQPTRAPEAPVLDRPAPRLIASAAERANAEVGHGQAKPSVARRAEPVARAKVSRAPADRQLARATEPRASALA